MALAIGFRNQEYDDAVPLYCVAQDDWVLNRNLGQWLKGPELLAMFTAEGYVFPETEVAPPPESWQDFHEPHEFWSGEAGGREWGWSTSFPDPTP